MSEHDDDRPPIEHDAGDGRDLVHRRDQAVARHEQAAPIFNPLDAPPEHFGRALAQRQANYATLREYLAATLIPGKDFGRVHIDKNCEAKNRCRYDEAPWHFSDNTLFSPGADKILGLLGLAPTYPGHADYRRQALRGNQVTSVVMACQIVDAQGRVITEGMGAADLSEHRGSLHNTISKSQKRSRLEAVRRLPAVSALFEDPNFISAADMKMVEAQRARTEQRRAAQDPVQPPPRSRYASGKDIATMPFGRYKDRPLRELGDDYLEWIVSDITDKPDLVDSARREIDRRRLQEPAAAQPKQTPGVDLPQDDDGFDSDGPPPDAYFR